MSRVSCLGEFQYSPSLIRLKKLSLTSNLQWSHRPCHERGSPSSRAIAVPSMSAGRVLLGALAHSAAEAFQLVACPSRLFLSGDMRLAPRSTVLREGGERWEVWGEFDTIAICSRVGLTRTGVMAWRQLFHTHHPTQAPAINTFASAQSLRISAPDIIVQTISLPLCTCNCFGYASPRCSLEPCTAPCALGQCWWLRASHP